MAKTKKEITFEEKLEQVEHMITSLNNDNLPLQEAVAVHAKALELIKESEDYLKKAALQFETIEP